MKPLTIARMDWNKLKWFYLMAQFPSLSYAATTLKIDQSSLSRTLGTLEDRLGVKLFERRARGMHLLKEGKELLNVIAPSFQAFTHYEAHRQEQHTQVRGSLCVALSSFLPVSWLMRKTSHFLKQYPDLQFSLIQAQASKEAFIQQADCSIQEYDPDQEDEVVQQPLVTLSYGLYVSQSYLNHHGPLERIEDIETHAKILLKTPSNPAWGWPNAVPYNSDTSKIHEFSTAEDILWAAQQGLGIAALPRRQAAEHHDLVALPFYIEDHKVDLYYSYPKSSQSFKRVTLYGDFLHQTLKNKTGSVSQHADPSHKLPLAAEQAGMRYA